MRKILYIRKIPICKKVSIDENMKYMKKNVIIDNRKYF